MQLPGNLSSYQDSIAMANKSETVIAGSAACRAKLTHGATAPGKREPRAPLGSAVSSRS